MSRILKKVNALCSSCILAGDRDLFVKFMVKNDMLFDTVDYLSLQFSGTEHKFTLEVSKDPTFYETYLTASLVVQSQQVYDDIRAWWFEQSKSTNSLIDLRVSLSRENSEIYLPFFNESEVDSRFSYSDRSIINLGRNEALSYLRRSPFLVSRLREVEKEASQFFSPYLGSQIELHTDPSFGGVSLWLEVFTYYQGERDVSQELEDWRNFSCKVDQLTENYFSVNHSVHSRDSSESPYYAIILSPRPEDSLGLYKIVKAQDLETQKDSLSYWKTGRSLPTWVLNDWFPTLSELEQYLKDSEWERLDGVTIEDNKSIDEDTAKKWWDRNKTWLLESHLNRFVVLSLGISIGIFDTWEEAYGLGRERSGSDEFCIIEVNQTGTIRCHGRDLLNQAA